MTILMTGLCEKGADQIWKQCNDAMYAQGVTWLEEAAYAGDAEAWFFLGHCYSWGVIMLWLCSALVRSHFQPVLS